MSSVQKRLPQRFPWTPHWFPWPAGSSRSQPPTHLGVLASTCTEVTTCMGACGAGVLRRRGMKFGRRCKHGLRCRHGSRYRQGQLGQRAVRTGQPCCGEGRAQTLVVERLGSRFLRRMGEDMWGRTQRVEPRVGGLRWHAMRVGRLLRSTEGVGAESHRVTGSQGRRFKESRRVAESISQRISRWQAGWVVAAWH